MTDFDLFLNKSHKDIYDWDSEEYSNLVKQYWFENCLNL